MFQIGPFKIDSSCVLAPMAGVTDAPFRRLCREHGAGLATSEMVTSDVRLWKSSKTQGRLASLKQEHQPVSIQIAGSEPAMMAEAAKQAVELGAQIIDINMGCPAKKVCKKLAGSALLQNESLVADILTAVVNSVDVPVTLKTRTGWSPDERNGTRIAGIAEQCGIQALTVHGRTRACRFEGQAEYDTIAEIVGQVSIPVIANGDIDSPEKAKQVLENTGAAALMIGRSALGAPWIFKQINHYLATAERCSDISLDHKLKTVSRHLKELTEFYGEIKGARIARKHVRWYLGESASAKKFLKHFNTLNTSQSQTEAVVAFLSRPKSHEENVA
ncbi:tRNA-U20-dihydrouridine synthase [Alteromonadaceae bacterium Bs31]|nr:tRNA-U20-dihydrouridine synthase [Alteromonadaceae bacterium Bs31]